MLEGELGFRLGEEEVIARAGSAVLASRGTPHTYWNAGDQEARYLLVMTPNIATLIKAIHQPGADMTKELERRTTRSSSPGSERTCGQDDGREQHGALGANAAAARAA